MFDYLKLHDGPVISGLEQHEKVYAKDQPQYLPMRTLPGENGDSAIARFHLTDAQRTAIAEGADIYLEILHYRGPLAPSRLMVVSEPSPENQANFCAWWKAQTKGTYAVADARKSEPVGYTLGAAGGGAEVKGEITASAVIDGPGSQSQASEPARYSVSTYRYGDDQ